MPDDTITIRPSTSTPSFALVINWGALSPLVKSLTISSTTQGSKTRVDELRNFQVKLLIGPTRLKLLFYHDFYILLATIDIGKSPVSVLASLQG